MKKTISLLLLLIIIYSPNVFAHEMYTDGWHIVPTNTEENISKTWSQQTKEWAYYENGKEIMRYSKLIGSHRGWGSAPENSLASFKATKEKGYYAFETDVRFTKDNVAVLSHDAKINTVARNNDLSVIAEDVFIKDLTYNQLKSNYIFNIDRLNHNGTATVLDGYNSNRITTFEEMLDYVKENKMYVSIELKEGTKEQIESLVKMTQEKNMHNYIRWISFYTDLLKIVKDYDSDEYLGVTKNDTCDSVHNLYCGEEIEYYLKKLKTDNNFLWIVHNTDRMPEIACAVDLPLNESSYPATMGISTPITQGNVKLNNNSVNLLIGSNVSITYDYSGDGIVKCESSNINQATCSVDKVNKKINISSVGKDSTSVNIMVYSSQGINTSASNDNIIKVNISDNKENVEILTNVPDTFMKISKVSLIISIIIITLGITIIGYYIITEQS